MPASERLHMVQLSLDPRQLAALGLRAGLPAHQDDLEYLVHAQLAALFGKGKVQPFRVMGDQRRVSVLGYSAANGQALQEHAADFAEPADHAACDWASFASKPMPATWNAGRRLGFEVRICPVVRLARAAEAEGPDGAPLRYGRGAEVDAWVHQRFLLHGEATTRDNVYHGWLADRLEGAARLEGSTLAGFRRRRLVRKTQGSERKARILERPEALLRGTLEITDPERFRGLLSRGVGRHTAFGFGMLLLRAPD